MTKLVFDKQDLTVVQLASGTFTSASLDEILAMARRARDECASRKGLVQWITIIEDQAEAPNAVDRKRIIDAVRQIPRLQSATVVTSTFHRTILTAFGWIRPSVAGHRYGNFASTGDALRWLEGLDGKRASWPRLLAEVRRTSPEITAS